MLHQNSASCSHAQAALTLNNHAHEHRVYNIEKRIRCHNGVSISLDMHTRRSSDNLFSPSLQKEPGTRHRSPYTDGNMRGERTRSLKRSTRLKTTYSFLTDAVIGEELCRLPPRRRNDTQCITSAQWHIVEHRTVPCLHVVSNDTREDSTMNAKCAERCKDQMHLAFHDMGNSD